MAEPSVVAAHTLVVEAWEQMNSVLVMMIGRLVLVIVAS